MYGGCHKGSTLFYLPISSSTTSWAVYHAFGFCHEAEVLFGSVTFLAKAMQHCILYSYRHVQVWPKGHCGCRNLGIKSTVKAWEHRQRTLWTFCLGPGRPAAFGASRTRQSEILQFGCPRSPETHIHITIWYLKDSLSYIIKGFFVWKPSCW